MIRFTFPLGPSQVTIDADTPEDLIRQAAFFGELPERCSECGAAWRFTLRNITGEYFNLRCSGSPSHEFPLSQHKKEKGGGLYVDRKKATWTLTGRQEEPATPRTEIRRAVAPPPPSPVTPSLPLSTADLYCTNDACGVQINKRQHDATKLGPHGRPLCQRCAREIRPVTAGGRR